MGTRTVDPGEWTSELDGFSRQHEGWVVSLTRRTADGRTTVEAHDVPLEGVTVSSRDPADIAVTVGGAREHLTHHIHDAVGLRIELTADRAERAMDIDARDGSTIRIAFRSPRRVEEVDGLPESRDL